ncbi:MAG: DUF3570 domain-containing protein, partial [Campylobacterota bacterium]|nr:DUF3570 domain-containing protein [Campylobacterota bacterium]
MEYDDKRIAMGLLLTTRFENRDELVVGVSRSNEKDFYSSEISSEYMHWLSDSKNNSISFGLSYQFNQILKYCSNVSVDGCSGASEEMRAHAINTQLSFSQNIDSHSNAKIALFYIQDSGYLDNPYLNIIRNYQADASSDIVGESRPDSKKAYGVALKYANAFTDSFTLHLDYRYYRDDWEINSHTLDLNTYYELNDDWLFKVGLRTYIQSEASFYNASPKFFTNQLYASSDQRLSDFNAITYKSAFDYKIYEDTSINLGV